MPTYDYICDACEYRFETQQEITADPLKKCPECGKMQLRRIVSGGLGFQLKGNGFYGNGRINTEGGSISY